MERQIKNHVHVKIKGKRKRFSRETKLPPKILYFLQNDFEESLCEMRVFTHLF